jgi:PmbA protein
VKRLAETLEALAGAGFADAEAYAKRGRSRRLSLGVGGRSAAFHQEEGWAVRATTQRASLFYAASGAPRPDTAWPQADGYPLALPDPDAAGAAAPWSEPSDFETPLIGETEGLRLLAAVAAALGDEMPTARLLSAVLEDGSSESRLLSSRGVEAHGRRRVAVFHAEAALGDVGARLDLARREARLFGPAELARLLADRLVAAAGGVPQGFSSRDRGELVLAPAVGAHLLAALTPYLVGAPAAHLAATVVDRRGRFAAETVTVVDDGRHPGGTLESARDGEGLPTRRTVLVDAGVYRQPLLSWAEVAAGVRPATGAKPAAKPAGCARRASWRDPPRPGPTHLHLVADPAVPAAALLADLARGYYLLDVTAPPRLDPAQGAFRVPVCGFAVHGGRAREAVSGVELCGTVGALLRGVQGVARDLAFFPLDGMVGAPTIKVGGLELRAAGR